MSAREAALRVLLAVTLRGRFLDDALDTARSKLASPRDRALAAELAYGVCRQWFRLQALADVLMDRPLRQRDADVGVVIALGLYQLAHSRIPAHAAVSETVALCRTLRKAWAGGLVNAVLRRFQRDGEALAARVDRDDAARLAHPRWLLDVLQHGWPERWPDIASANNAQAPMTLRVNRQRSSRDDYLTRLAAQGLEATPTLHAPEGVTLARAVDVEALPGFREGVVSVQDEAAQLCAGLIDATGDGPYLDACSAPGGKLAHALERDPHLNAVAVERDGARMARTESTLARLGLEARLVLGDAGAPDSWWDGEPFARILVDAPCSATGVIRRHPDVRIHRTAGDIASLADEQLRLLSGLWPTLARGGRLLYATCSVMPEENASVIARFIDGRDDVEPSPIEAPWGVPAAPGRQVLPGEAGMDGFYYALLVKR